MFSDLVAGSLEASFTIHAKTKILEKLLSIARKSDDSTAEGEVLGNYWQF